MSIRVDVNNTLDFTKIDPSTWKNSDEVEKLVDRLRTATKIITKEGNTTREYTRQNWTKYQDILALNSDNPKKAEILCAAFNDAFSEMPEGEDREKIKTFIENNQIFIGSRKPEFNFANSSISNLVLNTIHHEINHYPDFGIPVAFVNTDFELPPQLLELRHNVQSDQLKIFTPIDYQLKGVEGVVTIGFPIRKGFETPITAEAKTEIRKKYNSEDNEWLIVVQMGSLAGRIEKDMRKLIEQTKKLNKKCHFVFLCGDNQKLKDTVSRAANEICSKDPTQPQNVFFHVEDLLDDHQLGALFQTCDAVLGKPGGATTAEIAATGAFLFSYDPFPWETSNQEYLEKRNQSIKIDDFKDLVRFISNNEKTRTHIKASESLNWRENLIKAIDDIVQSKLENTAHARIHVKYPYSTSASVSHS